MASKPEECRYFHEDEVIRFHPKHGLQFGLIVENAEIFSSDEDSDSDSDSSISGDEQQQQQQHPGWHQLFMKKAKERVKRLKPGFVRVAWHPMGHEEVVPERKLTLSDRSLMPGDVVKRLNGGQKGYCRDIKVTTAVKVVKTDSVILNADSDSLRPLTEFRPDIVVDLDSWVGLIRDVKVKVRVKFNVDGSSAVMDADDLDELEDVHEDERGEQFAAEEFYPGQVLSGYLRQFKKMAEFEAKNAEMEKNLNKNNHQAYNNKRFRVTVQDSFVENINVQWQCQSYSDQNLINSMKNKNNDDQQVRFLRTITEDYRGFRKYRIREYQIFSENGHFAKLKFSIKK